MPAPRSWPALARGISRKGRRSRLTRSTAARRAASSRPWSASRTSSPGRRARAVMETAGPIGAALGLAVASGLSLYGAVFVSGLAIRLGWVHPDLTWASLGVLADPVVLGVSGVLLAIEFLADKIPLV